MTEYDKLAHFNNEDVRPIANVSTNPAEAGHSGSFKG